MGRKCETKLLSSNSSQTFFVMCNIAETKKYSTFKEFIESYMLSKIDYYYPLYYEKLSMLNLTEQGTVGWWGFISINIQK